ncbi:DNA-protecting protein DprA [Candidatus Nomurabacteria bacterium]|nr:DNA-processing protein DprA [Candidatus Kaiserbacteria bacterium]MCB9810304.1 DNA-protecting protein DprA [Candidatus Nomurabacteria bacterium]MCB9818487.1 DNA-protecting protein DprA [Candidatus Nomurabacteria bacterium]
MHFPIEVLPAGGFPVGLREIPQSPKSLNYRGHLPSPELKLLSIVGSRKYTSYGKQVIEELVGGLKNYPIGIVSGMALGVDSLAHESALKNNLYTLAIPGGGLSDQRLYPATHKKLAYRILEAGGGLLSEFDPDFQATNWSFPQRNRLVAGISQATLLIEAAEKSGTLITARMATDYNRDLLVVPGSIFSSNSKGVHQFLKLGATPVTSSKDILDALGIEENDTAPTQQKLTLSPAEQLVINLLHEPTHRDELIRKIDLPVHESTQLLMLMEINGLISSNQNVYRNSL